LHNLETNNSEFNTTSPSTTKPTQQIKITVSSLENQIEELKDRNKRLQVKEKKLIL
jgi:hypothetical protein